MKMHISCHYISCRIDHFISLNRILENVVKTTSNNGTNIDVLVSIMNVCGQLFDSIKHVNLKKN